jgi:hypothetical protein
MKSPELAYMDRAAEDWTPAGSMANVFRIIVGRELAKAIRHDAESAPFDIYTVPGPMADSIRNMFRSLSRLYSRNLSR